MAVKDPENYKQRGIRVDNETWDALQQLARVNGRSASKEAAAAIAYHLKRNRERGKI